MPMPLLALMLVDLMAVITPGPSFLAVLQRAIGHGARAGFAVTLGLVVADWLWCAIALGGLFAIFRIVPWLYGALRICGGGYLVWLGIQFWRQGHASPVISAASAQPENLPEGLPEDLATNSGANGGNFVKGVLVGLTNPKAAIYYSCIFAQFVHPDSPLRFRAVAVGLITIDGLIWYGFVAAAVSRARVRAVYDRCRSRMERCAGTVMAAFGIGLLFEGNS